MKYHLGATGTFRNPFRTDAEIAVSLASNPSHLETVNPVLEGIVRAKQDMIDKGEQGFTVLPVLLHGDSAFAGQGVVAETLNLSQLRGYRTGGTVHVVINNQVGFTTSPAAARSSLYSTDVARMIGAPVFHVNGDDPEACVRVARLAVEYRQAFKKDVVIDLVCYRRRGHNEGDDPSMTQPQMYDIIDRKRSVRKLYTEALVGRGDITLAEAEEALKDYRGQLERAFAETHDAQETSKPTPAMDPRTPQESTVKTAITPEILKAIGDAHVSLPQDFTVHPKLQRMLERRAAMTSEGNVDWAMGELLAFGSLLMDGVPVRLAGQDSRRGTFVQRHSVLIDRENGAEYTPLANLTDDQAKFFVYDSLLSEYAALGFEYGYSVANPKALVLWEAQFGDFVDGAQMVIDEFISSGEAKWGQRSGVVMLLPHGLEGQGPDHSSGRIERFLQLSAENNMTVANCSTPANYFHLLRRQALSDVHRPLVVFTPKSLLRAKAAVSAGRRLHRRGLPPGPAGHGCGRGAVGRRRGAPGAALHRQGRLRPHGPAGVRGHRRRRRRPGGAALPAAGRADPRAARALPERHRRGVGAGGADEHGRVAVHGRQPPAGPAPGPHLPLRQPQGVGQPGRRLGQGARGRAASADRRGVRGLGAAMYFTDRGLEELADRRGEEQVTLAWLADQMQAFVDEYPDFEVPVERLATWLARGGTDDVDDD